MKKWILTLISLGYLSPVHATAHDSFLVTGETLTEVANYDHVFEVPNFFSRVYPQNLNPNLVVVPRTNSGFMFGLIGAMWRPFDNQTDYVIPDSTPLAFSPSVNSNIREISPDYNFAYGAYIGYVYPYTGRDIRFDFIVFDDSVTDSITAPIGGTLWTPLALYDRTVEAQSAFSIYKTNMEYAKLMMGQTIFAGTRLRIHPALGLAYAGIDREIKTTYTGASGILTPVFGDSFVTQKSSFNGAGPAAQFDLAYFLAPHFALTGHILSSILIGSISSDIRYTEDLLEFAIPANTEIDLNSADRAVVNLDGKLGVLFEYPFCGSYSKLDIEIGYEFNHFFNAVDSYRSTGSVFLSDSAVLFYNTPLHVKHPHDLTFDGPYLNIGLSGIACPNNVVIDPLCVTVPNLEGGFVFGIGAAYFRMGHNHHDFALLDPHPTPLENFDIVPSLDATLEEVPNDNSYGLILDIGYVFRNTPYDITAHFEGLSGDDSEKVIAPEGGVVWPILITPFLTNDQTGIFASRANAHLKNSYYEFHVDFGQAISADNLAWFRIFEGVEYARLYSDLHVTYDNLISPITNNVTEDSVTFPQADVVQKSRFAGYGPRFGIDMALPMGWINLVSEIAGGFLFGNVDTTYSDTYQAGVDTFNPDVVLIPGGTIGTQLDSKNQVSPFLDLKVGIGYGFDFFAQTRWTVELGYKAAHYFNAATTFRHATNNAAVFVKQVDDITIDGPYLLVSITGFGRCPPDCIPRQPYCVIVPELKGGFEVALEYLYLRPNVDNIDFAIVDPSPTFVPNVPDSNLNQASELNPGPRSKVQILRPQFENGYRVHLGYIFPFTSNDVSVNFAEMQGETSGHAMAPAGGLLWTITNGTFGTVSPIDTTFFPITAERAEVAAKFDWQTGNIEFGKRVKFYNLMVRVFGGLTYADVNENINIRYLNGIVNSPDPEPTVVDEDTLFQGNDFSGFGPRLGVSGDLNFACGLSLTGLVATDLLVGTIDSSLLETSSSGDATTLDPTKRTRLAPAVDAKIGLAYTLALKNCAQISIEGGYQMNHYFNVKDSLRFTGNSSAFIKQDQDISFDGPYGRLQINF